MRSPRPTAIPHGLDLFVAFDRAERILILNRRIRRAMSALALGGVLLMAMAMLDYPRQVLGMPVWQADVAQLTLQRIGALQRIHHQATGRYSDSLLERDDFASDPLFHFATYTRADGQLYQAVAVGRANTALEGQLHTFTQVWTDEGTRNVPSVFATPIAHAPNWPRQPS